GGTPRGPASPYSTGGGGHDFERGIAAYYVAGLLSGASPRGVPDGSILREVLLQTSYTGDLLDDLTIVADLATGPMIVHMQVKHDITFTCGDLTFDEVLRDCWATFTSESFNIDLDRMALVVGVAQRLISQHYQPLLRTVRTSSDASAFFARVLPGQMAAEQRGLIDLVREKLDSYAGEPVPDDTLWRFLRALAILDFDVQDEGSRDRTFALEMLRHIVPNNSPGRASDLFAHLDRYAGEGQYAAGVYSRESLTLQLQRENVWLLLPVEQRAELARITAEAAATLGDIRADIGGVTLDRISLMDEAQRLVACAAVVEVVGPPGIGKSAILKALAQRQQADVPTLVFSWDRLDVTGWSGFASRLPLHQSLRDILLAVSGTSHPCIFIDGIDRIVEPGARACINDVLREIRRMPLSDDGARHWCVLATARDENIDDVYAWLDLEGLGDPVALQIPPLSTAERATVIAAHPGLAPIMTQPTLTPVAENPFFLRLLLQTVNRADEQPLPQILSETDAHQLWWERIVGRRDGALSGRTRQQALLAIGRAVIRHPGQRFPLEVLPNGEVAESLERDQILLYDPHRDTYRFAHDLLEDWTFRRVLDREREDLPRYLRDIGEPVGLLRAVQLLGVSVLETEGPAPWFALTDRLSSPDDQSPRWSDALLSAPLQSARTRDLLDRGATELLANDGRRMAAILQTVRPFACGYGTYNAFPGMRPAMEARWRTVEPMLAWLLARADALPVVLRPAVAALMVMWQVGTPDGWAHRHEVGGVAVRWYSEIEPRTHWMLADEEEAHARELRRIVIHSADCLPDEVGAFLASLAMGTGAWEAKEEAISAYRPLVRHLPAQYVDFALSVLVASAEEHRHYAFDADHSLGIHMDRTFFPPADIQGPFLALLRANLDEGLRLIHGLANSAVAMWREAEQHRREPGERRTPVPAILTIGGDRREFWGDERVYRWFRPHGPGPDAVKCALMALETWMEDQVAQGRDPSELFEAVLAGSMCVAMPAVCLSVAMAFPDRCLHAALLLVGSPMTWRLDMIRAGYDAQPSPALDPFDQHTRIYERQAERGARPQRAMNLPHFVCYYQATDDPSLAVALEHAVAGWDTPPLWCEEEASNIAQVASLREDMEDYQAACVRANYRLIPSGDDTQVVYIAPDHLRQRNEPGYVRALEMQRWLATMTWAQETIESRTPAAGMSMEEALATAQAIARPDDFTYAYNERDVDAFRLQAIAGATAAILWVGFDWAAAHGAIPWCRGILLATARMPRPRALGEYQYPADPLVAAGLGLGCLVAHGVADDAVRVQILRVVGAQGGSAVFRGIGDRWQVDAVLFWNALALAIAACLVPDPLGRYYRDDGIDAAERERVEALIPGFIANLATAVVPDLPRIHGVAATFWWEVARYTLGRLPLASLLTDSGGRSRLLALADDLMAWTVAANTPPARERNGIDHYPPELWNHFFYEWAACLARSLTLDEARRHVLHPVRDAWPVIPRLTAHLMNGYIQCQIGWMEPLSAEAQGGWREICAWVLANVPPRIPSAGSRREQGVFDSLSLVVFVEFGKAHLIKEWPHVGVFVDVIDRWVARVGSGPDLYHNLLILLVTGPGLTMPPAQALDWAHRCVSGNDDPRAPLTHRNNGALTLLLLMLVWGRAEDLVRSNTTVRQHFTYLVDHLVVVQVPGADELQQRLEQRR
ncbi:MAG: AAA family ATPase, partial [Thermomicrobiales bacterium]